jgi:hypothetical protein
MSKKLKQLGLKNNLDKIIFLIATAYFIAVGVWFIRQEKQQTLASVNTQILPNQQGLVSSQENIVNQTDNKEQETTIKPQINQPNIKPETTQLTTNSTQNLPRIDVSRTVTSQPSSIPMQKNNNSNIVTNKSKVDQQILPPPPPPTLPSSLPTPLSLAKVSVTSNTPVKVSSPPPPKPSSSVQSQPQPQPQKVTSVPILNFQGKKPVSVSSNQSILPPPPPPSSLSSSENSQFNTPNINNQEITANINIQAGYSLVGLIELDDQSSALFKNNNSTEKVKLGEQIGLTGWILVSIYNQQAIIQKQGNTKTLIVGQDF